MSIREAFQTFFQALNGTKPTGSNIEEVIRNGAASVQRNNESAIANRVAAAETSLSNLQSSVEAVNNAYALKRDYNVEEFVIKSSTNDSEKRFTITVADDGTISAIELVQYTATWTIGEGITTRIVRNGVEIQTTDPVFNGDVLTLYATPPAGRTFAPLSVTGITYEGAPSSSDGMTFTVNTDFSVTLPLADIS